jgi:serine protease
MPLPRGFLFGLIVAFALVVSSGSAHAQLPFLAGGHEPDLIEIKFREGSQVRLRDGRPVDLSQGLLHSVHAQELLSRYADGHWERTHSRVSEEFLHELRSRGMERGANNLPDLNLWFRLRLPEGISAPQAWLDWDQLDAVESVWFVSQPTPNPQSTIPDYRRFDPANPGQRWQRYLDPAPDGIDLDFVRQNYLLVLTGAGIRVCDIEYMINPDHEDLNNVTVLDDMVDLGNFGDDHGTAVMGQIGARPNAWGTQGIAPDAQLYFSPSGSTGSVNIADAITTALTVLEAGDVILLEAQSVGPNWTANSGQFGLVPVEWEKAIFDAIVTATAAGVVVVEAGANGSQNLDGNIYSVGNNGHHPFVVANGVRQTDSGAIIVGGANSPWRAAPRAANNTTNFGQRIDVQGYGNDIVTNGYGTLFPGIRVDGDPPDTEVLPPDPDQKNLFFTSTFGGTSGASPIATGAVILVQEYAKRLNGPGNPLLPEEVRQLLIDTGTPQEGTRLIGPMPHLPAAILELASQYPVDPPSFDPPPGAYSDNPFDIKIPLPDGAVWPDITVRYTTDGSPVTRNSRMLLPNNSLRLRNPTSVRARTFSGNFTQSVEIVGFFNIPPSVPTVANVNIQPEATTFPTSTFVGLSTTTPDAQIYATTDGSDPSPFNGTLVDSGVIGPLFQTTLVRARAFKDQHEPSAITQRLYELVAPPPQEAGGPVLIPGPGNFYNPVNLQIIPQNSNDIVRYTLDGSEPTDTSPIFEFSGDGLVINATTEVLARAFRAGAEPSETTGGVFTIFGTVATPTISVSGSPPHIGSASVSLSTISPGATIRYTINGDTPQPFSTAYSGPIGLGVGGHAIRARAFAGDLASATSLVTVEVFSVDGSQAEQPVARPLSQIHVEPLSVSLSTTTEGATIRYEVSTGLPIEVTAASPAYTGPFELNNTEGNATESTYYQITARAFKAGLTTSTQMQKPYEVATPLGTISTPVVSTTAEPNPATGKFDNTITVNFSAFTTPSTTGIQYYRTIDGSDPEVPDPPSVGPNSFTLNRNATVKAIAYRTFFGASGISIPAVFEFQVAPPVISPAESDHEGEVEISIATNTSGGGTTLRYTLDGSEPTAASAAYGGPFTLAVGDYVLRARGFRTNFHPSPISTVYFTVVPPAEAPAILTQPVAATVTQGQDVLLLVAASGNPAPEYQWHVDGEPLGGATEPFLLIPGALPGDSGLYSAVVSNSAGQATSDAVLVQVDEPPAHEVFADRFEAEIEP